MIPDTTVGKRLRGSSPQNKPPLKRAGGDRNAVDHGSSCLKGTRHNAFLFLGNPSIAIAVLGNISHLFGPDRQRSRSFVLGPVAQNTIQQNKNPNPELPQKTRISPYPPPIRNILFHGVGGVPGCAISRFCFAACGLGCVAKIPRAVTCLPHQQCHVDVVFSVISSNAGKGASLKCVLGGFVMFGCFLLLRDSVWSAKEGLIKYERSLFSSTQKKRNTTKEGLRAPPFPA